LHPCLSLGTEKHLGIVVSIASSLSTHHRKVAVFKGGEFLFLIELNGDGCLCVINEII
jgi:hypothetical protein